MTRRLRTMAYWGSMFAVAALLGLWLAPTLELRILLAVAVYFAFELIRR